MLLEELEREVELEKENPKEEVLLLEENEKLSLEEDRLLEVEELLLEDEEGPLEEPGRQISPV